MAGCYEHGETLLDSPKGLCFMELSFLVIVRAIDLVPTPVSCINDT
jgi:hypothetical protein